LVFVDLDRLFPKICEALAVVKPDTIVRWHRAGFRLYCCWKSRRHGGRSTVPPETRQLVREMSIANPLWGAPRIHGELLKIGIDIGQTSVVVPTILFRLLYGLLIMGHGRRQVLWFGVTSHPTAEWIANQLTEACGWEQVPRYLIRSGWGLWRGLHPTTSLNGHS
jgi:hypothetical protein